jgi:hypothetical protein
MAMRQPDCEDKVTGAPFGWWGCCVQVGGAVAVAQVTNNEYHLTSTALDHGELLCVSLLLQYSIMVKQVPFINLQIKIHDTSDYIAVEHNVTDSKNCDKLLEQQLLSKLKLNTTQL